MPHSTAPPPPHPLLEKYIFFALPSMNGPLTAELKFRENTGSKGSISQEVCSHGPSLTAYMFVSTVELTVELCSSDTNLKWTSI